MTSSEMTASEEQAFEELLDHIQSSRNIDFHVYKRLSLKRRVLRRMQQVGIESFEKYADYLDKHPNEFSQLFNTILINVTSFFRDLPAWEYLEEEIIPHILSEKESEQPIRIWSAGCASGEETYTLAMLMAEAIGSEAFIERVKIYGTDMDEYALNTARRANFSAKAVQPIPPELLSKYFSENSGRYVFRSDLRRSIIFGNHDLTKDAPISRLDLLVCRNTLMYFNSEAQKKILTFFHFGLKDGGYLFLGKAETLLLHAGLFTPAAAKLRIFFKKSKTDVRERALFLSEAALEETEPAPSSQTRLREVAIEGSPIAHAIIDGNGILVMVNQRMRSLFNLTLKDVGRRFADLELSHRPADLRPLVEKVFRQWQPERLVKVQYIAPTGEQLYLDIRVVPLKGHGKTPLGVDLIFEDVTAQQKLEEDLTHTNQKLEAVNEELQSAQEELETTNEELQSTNEELETTNEELQSANEELETINEELQSTNEELITLNEDHQQRTGELNITNAFLNSILSSMHAGVMVVDDRLNLLLWNNRAEDLWGLRADEVRGKSLLSLEIGLPVEKLPLRAFINGTAEYKELTLDAINRRGKAFPCHVECTPFTNAQGQREGLVLFMDEAPGDSRK